MIPANGSVPHKRILAAVLSADVAGYSRLMEGHETATIAALEASREIFRERIAAHDGRVVDMSGDSVLAIFDSAIEAVQSALEVQCALDRRNVSVESDRMMKFRIGINLGDIVQKADGTVYGDGVNIAARLQTLAAPGGICISGNIHEVCASRLSLDEEDLGEKRVKNIKTRVRAYRISAPGNPRAMPEVSRHSAVAAPGKASIVVLPFENASGDRDEDYFADGLAEDIITALSKFRSLAVIARNSAFAHKSRNAPGVEIAAELGARYLVHGTVRRAGDRARVKVELIEVETSAELWAERFDRQLDDVFGIQDEITQKIVSILPGRIEAADLKRIQNKPTESLAAYEYLLKGKYHHHRATREDNRIALEMLERAIALDPAYAQAHAWKACTVAQAMVRAFADDDAALGTIMDCLQTALALDEDDFETHRILSGVYLIQRRFERALYHAARAFELNPNDPRVMSQYGEILTALGKADDAIIVLQQALELDPYQPDRRLNNLAIAEFVARRYRDALDTLPRIAVLDARHHSYFAACYAQLGDTVNAARHAEEVRRALPEFDAGVFVDEIPYSENSDREHHLAALTAAGLGSAGN